MILARSDFVNVHRRFAWALDIQPFSYCIVERKRDRIHHMNPRKAVLLIVFTTSAALALAADFKTNNGKEYKNAMVTQVDPEGIVVKSKTGISKLYFTELPEDVQKRYHYDPANAAAAAAAQVAVTQRTNQQIEEANKQREKEKQVALESSRSEEHTSDSSHLGISYAVFC